MNKRSVIKAIGIAVAISIGALQGVAQAQSAPGGTLKEVLDRGTIRVGVLGAFKPWSFPSPDGTMQGIDIDLANTVADALGVKLETVVITSSNRMQFLQQGKIDVIIGGMGDTSERRKAVGIVEPGYWASGPTLMAKKGLIKDWKDITGKPVCTKQGCLYNQPIEEKFHPQIVAFSGNSEGKAALRSGKCMAWLYDNVSIAVDLASGEWKDYEMPVAAPFSQPWMVGVPLDEKDKAWGIFMSGMAYEWQASGKLIELSKKWGIEPSEWLVQQHDKAKWDVSYLADKKP